VIRGLVFDIDDTLYLERDYVRSGFDAVAQAAATSDEEAAALFAWLEGAFDAGIRGDTLDRMLGAYPAVRDRTTVADLVGVYRAHAPAIGLAPGFEAVLDDLRSRDVRLGVLSDGPAVSQAAKVDALDLVRWFEPIVLTGALGDGFVKPSTAGFALFSDAWTIPAGELAYVADNPAKDFAGPRRLGWTTVRLRTAGQLRFALEAVDDAYGPDIEIATPTEILGLPIVPG